MGNVNKCSFSRPDEDKDNKIISEKSERSKVNKIINIVDLTTIRFNIARTSISYNFLEYYEDIFHPKFQNARFENEKCLEYGTRSTNYVYRFLYNEDLGYTYIPTSSDLNIYVGNELLKGREIIKEVIFLDVPSRPYIKFQLLTEIFGRDKTKYLKDIVNTFITALYEFEMDYLLEIIKNITIAITVNNLHDIEGTIIYIGNTIFSDRSTVQSFIGEIRKKISQDLYWSILSPDSYEYDCVPLLGTHTNGFTKYPTKFSVLDMKHIQYEKYLIQPKFFINTYTHKVLANIGENLSNDEKISPRSDESVSPRSRANSIYCSEFNIIS